jgi:hypothetical protein
LGENNEVILTVALMTFLMYLPHILPAVSSNLPKLFSVFKRVVRWGMPYVTHMNTYHINIIVLTNYRFYSGSDLRASTEEKGKNLVFPFTVQIDFSSTNMV